jgi:hypothetical protein
MSKIEVNAIEPQSGTTLTLGASGDTVALAAGALQSGFGRSGSVNWDTTPKTTSPVTAVSGNGYFINTTSIAITVNLPATPAAGDIVAISDYANTSATNNITVGRNGSLIDGSAVDAKIKVNGQVYTLVYIDATEGWKTVSQTFNQISTAEFIAATGGTITTCGNYKIHKFTGPGTFTVSSVGNPAGSTTVDYLVVAGGAGGGNRHGGGGGGGGFRESVPSPAAWTASPLANPGGSLPVSVTGYPITVGAGGGAGIPTTLGGAGNNSIFSTITSTAGGGGATGNNPPTLIGAAGGSGGGGSTCSTPSNPGGAGNTPPVSPPQGSAGGAGISDCAVYRDGGGGGGATAVGATHPAPATAANPGGAGATTSISGSPTSYAGGGGGGGSTSAGTGGVGGGGSGGINGTPSPSRNATTNTGGGGGGSGGNVPDVSGSGGSGIVIIRYKFQ